LGIVRRYRHQHLTLRPRFAHAVAERSADEGVIPRASEQAVLAATPIAAVVSGSSEQVVMPCIAKNLIVPRAIRQGVVTGSAFDRIAPTVAGEAVGALDYKCSVWQRGNPRG
jgi:hypothetical protein